MNQQCENCKWWNRKSIGTLSSGHKFAECLAPLPFWVTPDNQSDRNPLNTDGRYCDIYTPMGDKND